MTNHESSTSSAVAAACVESNIQRFSKIPVRLSVRLCHQTMKLKDLATISPGDCIQFESPCSAPLELLSGRSRLATGKAMRSGDRLAFCLNQSVTWIR